MSFRSQDGPTASISTNMSSIASLPSDRATSTLPSLNTAVKGVLEAIPRQSLDFLSSRLHNELLNPLITSTSIYQLLYDIITFQNLSWASSKSIPGAPCKIPMHLLLSLDEKGPLEAILRHLFLNEAREPQGMPIIDSTSYSSVARLVLSPPFFVFPQIHVSDECREKTELEHIATKYGATIGQLGKCSHFIVPPTLNETYDGLVVPLDFNESMGQVLVHFVGRPASYNTWVSETNLENFHRVIPPPPMQQRPHIVSTYFLRQLEEYGEWLSESDFHEAGMFEYSQKFLKYVSRSKKRPHDNIVGSQTEEVEAKRPKLESVDPSQWNGAANAKGIGHRASDTSRIGASATFTVLAQPSLKSIGGPSASGAMTSAGGHFKLTDRNSGPQPSLMLPPHNEWFHMNSIHDLERQALPEFFVDRPARSSNKSAEIYREYRDFMIHTYQQNPSQYLTYTSCRRSLAGDACAVLRVFDFLESAGLINYAISPDLHGTFPVTGAIPAPSEAAEQFLKIDNRMSSSLRAHPTSATGLSSAEGDASGQLSKPAAAALLREYTPMRTSAASQPVGLNAASSKRKDVLCSHCGKSTESVTFVPKGGANVRTNHKFCRDCFVLQAGSIDTSEYALIDQRGEKVSKEDMARPWSDSETLCLLDALEQFGDDWDKVAQYVGSRDKESCLLHFLRLPIDDPFVDQSSTTTQKSTPFALASSPSSNPIMQLVTFLSRTVSPKVAAAASQAAIKTFIAENFQTPSLDTNGTPLPKSQKEDPSAMDLDLDPRAQNGDTPHRSSQHEEISDIASIAGAGLSTAVLKSILLAEKEERDIRVLTHQIVDATLKKLELKMRYFEEMEHFLKEEHKKMEVAKTRVLDEKWNLEQEKRNLMELRQKIEFQARQMGLGLS